MNIQNHASAFTKLGKVFMDISGELHSKINTSLRTLSGKMTNSIKQAKKSNGWFTEDNILFSIKAWANALSEEKIRTWLEKYTQEINKSDNSKRVGVIMAGNIPLVGLHDALCVLASGNNLLAKVSSDDAGLTTTVLSSLIEIEPEYASRISLVENKLRDFDMIIATGSNNTARYFQYYFGKYPHIIRKNRNGIGIVAKENSCFEGLGEDIFRYFGLGCRNVSFLFIPEGLDIGLFMANFAAWESIKNHSKYMNNYQYHKALYLLNGDKFFDNGFFMMRESDQLQSPVGTIHYKYYNDPAEVRSFLNSHKEQWQCVVEEKDSYKGSIPYGKSQFPELWNYADNIDTMNFLLTEP